MISDELWTKARRTLVATLLALPAGLVGHFIVDNSVTNDEICHLASGVAIWERGMYYLYHENPPLMRRLTTLPVWWLHPHTDYSQAARYPGARQEREVGRSFMFANAARYHQLVCVARVVVLLLSLATCGLLYHWARLLFGDVAALLVLALWALNPNTIAHAGIAATDLGSAAFTVLALFVYWRYRLRPSLARATGVGVSLGLALLTKFSLAVLPPFVAGAWLVEKWQGRRFRWAHLGAMVALSFVVLWQGYDFQELFVPLKNFRFVSHSFVAEGETVGNRFRDSWLGELPAPFPAEYLRGLDSQASDFEKGFWSYLNGQMQRHGWWYYYLYATLVKNPLGTLVLWLAAGVLLFSRRYRLDGWSEAIILFPIAGILIPLSLSTGYNHHFRYVMPALPFFMLATGRLLKRGNWPGLPQMSFITLALLAAIVPVLRLHPQELTYFNLLAGGPEHGHEHLLESNIDWGQDLVRLRHWQEEHPEARPFFLAFHSQVDPEVYGVKYQPIVTPACEINGIPTWSPGWYGVSTNLVQGGSHPIADGRHGQILPPHRYLNLFQSFTPVARPGYGMFLYRLEERDIQKLCSRLRFARGNEPRG